MGQELALMVELGMSPLDAIVAATSVAARAIGRDDIGILRPGALADIAVWDGDPLADIAVLQTAPRAVFLGGVPIR
jgi:imidazolonepropionase-like amidohydrolase